MAKTFFNKTNIPRNSSGQPHIKFELFGQWAETVRAIQNLSPAIKAGSLRAQIIICQDIAKRVRKHIKYQDLNWEPLSLAYEEKKIDAGLDGGILQAYDTYYNAIQAWQSGNRHIAFVGVKKGIYTREISGKRSKWDVATIAGIHEFSTGPKIPKRPLWNPTIRELGGAKGLKKLYVKHLVGVLRTRGIPVKNLGKIF